MGKAEVFKFKFIFDYGDINIAHIYELLCDILIGVYIVHVTFFIRLNIFSPSNIYHVVMVKTFNSSGLLKCIAHRDHLRQKLSFIFHCILVFIDQPALPKTERFRYCLKVFPMPGKAVLLKSVSHVP